MQDDDRHLGLKDRQRRLARSQTLDWLVVRPDGRPEPTDRTRTRESRSLRGHDGRQRQRHLVFPGEEPHHQKTVVLNREERDRARECDGQHQRAQKQLRSRSYLELSGIPPAKRVQPGLQYRTL